MFEPFKTFSEEDYDELTIYFRWLWEMKNKQENLQASRLELLCVLRARNQAQISEEKRKLFQQISELELLPGSSPLRDSASSI